MKIIKAAVFLSLFITESSGAGSAGAEEMHAVVTGRDASFSESMVAKSLPSLGSNIPVIGSNIDGGSVFTNYVNLRRNGQFFHVGKGHTHPETFAKAPYRVALVHWCSQLAFTDIDKTLFGRPPVIGYTAHCLHISPFDLDITSYAFNGSTANAQGTGSLGKITEEFANTVAGYSLSISLNAVYVPQTNIFEVEYHSNSDNFVIRAWDDGSPTSATSGWEVHDAGDKSPMAASTSYSFVGSVEWATVEDAARVLNMDPNEFTPEAFDDLYQKVWIADEDQRENHKEETSSAFPDVPLSSLLTSLMVVAGLFAP